MNKAVTSMVSDFAGSFGLNGGGGEQALAQQAVAALININSGAKSTPTQ